MISNSLSCTRETKKMLCLVPGLCENRLHKKCLFQLAENTALIGEYPILPVAGSGPANMGPAKN